MDAVGKLTSTRIWMFRRKLHGRSLPKIGRPDGVSAWLSDADSVIFRTCR